MSAVELPPCHDRYCQSRARFKVAAFVDRETGEDGPPIDVCGTHRNIHERLNLGARRQHQADRSRDANRDLIDRLAAALKREAGIEIGSVRVGIAGVELRPETIFEITEWLDDLGDLS